MLDNRDNIVIHMDFMKAYNKVPHRRLHKKIVCFGNKGDILQWPA